MYFDNNNGDEYDANGNNDNGKIIVKNNLIACLKYPAICTLCV